MRKWLPLLAVCLGSFMLLVDVTIVNVALPDMANDLHTSFSTLQWVVDAYALTLAALLLGIGGLADLMGHRRVYLAGLSVFALSSLVCGIAPNAGLLDVARAVQGIGAAAMFATTFALLNAGYSGRERGIAYGVWGAVAGGAAAVGPILGGLLTQSLSWRWIFFVNLPVTVLALAMTLRAFDADRPAHQRKIDIRGTLAFTVAAGALTYGLIRANDDGWASGSVLGLFALAAVGLAAFVLVERTSPHAMLDLGLFGNRSFVGVILAALAINFAAFSALTYSTIWLQSVLGLSPIESGATGLPLSIASFAVSAAIGRLLHKSAPGPIIGGGLLLVGAGSLLDWLLVDSGSSWVALVPGFVVIGLGVGLALPTLSSTAMSAVPITRGGMAAGAVNTARQLSFAVGIAVLGTVFTSRAETALRGAGVPDPSGAARAVSGGQSQRILGAAPAGQRAHLDTVLHAAAASGVDGALLGAGIVGLVAGVLALVLIRPSRTAAPASATGAQTGAQTEAQTDATPASA